MLGSPPVHTFLLFLRRFIAFLFTISGFAGGACCLYGFGRFSWRWYQDGSLDQRDHGLWMVCWVLGLVCLGVFAAGLMLLLRPAPSKGETAFTKAAGPGRRQVAFSTAVNTVMWPLIAVLWFCVLPFPGGAAFRLGAAGAGFLALYFGIHAFIFCHELGHLSMAALLRLRISRLQVGTGPILLAGRVGLMRWEWRALHGGGVVHADSGDERGWRLRRWLMIAGGPAAHAAACALLAWWLWRHAGDDFLRSGWRDAPGFFALALLYYEAYRLLMALLPRAGSIDGRPLHTDGHWLLRLPFFSPAAVRRNVVIAALGFSERLWEDGRHDEARAQVRRIQARYPDDPTYVLMEGHFLVQEGEYAAAAVSFRRALGAGGVLSGARAHLAGHCFLALVRSGDADGARRFCADLLGETAPVQRANLLDAFATNAILVPLRGFLPDADAWSQEMVTIDPDQITRRGTRGAVLVELGRLDEGEAMLREVWRISKGPNDAAISAFYLGIAARNRGQERELRYWRKRALDFRAVLAKPFVARIETELVLAPPST